MALELQTHQNHHVLLLHYCHHKEGSHLRGASDGSCLASIHQAISPNGTLDLFHSYKSFSPRIELEEPSPLLFGWRKFLKLKTGEIYKRKVISEKMSRRNGKGPKLDLKLNLSPPRANLRMESPSRSATVSPTSPPSSCVSSENQDDTLRHSNSPEATSMVLVGCPRCLMYVMLSEDDPKCPKCKSTVLLDFLHDNTTTNLKARKS